MPLKKRKLKKTLRKKFGFERYEGSNHEGMRLTVDCKIVAQTWLSRSYSEISDGILGKIAGQLHVNLGTLKRMHSCQVDRADYLKLLREDGRLA